VTRSETRVNLQRCCLFLSSSKHKKTHTQIPITESVYTHTHTYAYLHRFPLRTRKNHSYCSLKESGIHIPEGKTAYPKPNSCCRTVHRPDQPLGLTGRKKLRHQRSGVATSHYECQRYSSVSFLCSVCKHGRTSFIWTYSKYRRLFSPSNLT
jgi:hypothetical protein